MIPGQMTVDDVLDDIAFNGHVPTATEVETFTGNFVDTKDPDPATIKLEDIAHALASTCRYGGHSQKFYSVAEHAVFCSIRVARRNYGRGLQFAALHHDDSEAYLGDIPRPIKPLLGDVYKQMTATVDTAICKALVADGPPWLKPKHFHDREVKNADSWSLFVEARSLLPSQGRQWWQGAQSTLTEAWELEAMPSRIVIPDYFLGGIEPAAAEQLFLTRHKELTTTT